MTIWIPILLVASVVFGIAYTMLGLQANDHLNENTSKSDRSIGWLFWWSFSKDKYDEQGKKLCAKGQILAYLLLSLYVAWYFILLKN
jgi:hypothetical protein